jgi:dsRNA-specific ribonuclease
MLADCFEALFGAIYIDQGLAACRAFFGKCIFSALNEEDLFRFWMSPKHHPLQACYTDRDQIASSPTLQKFCELEQNTGFIFRHIKLLVQAFTHPSVSNGLDVLDVGSNQRLEFLGDAVLQFIVSRYLFIHFPDHEEGQLTVCFYYFIQ